MNLVALVGLPVMLGVAMFGRPMAVGGDTLFGTGRPIAYVLVLIVPVVWRQIGLYRLRRHGRISSVLRRCLIGTSLLMAAIFTAMVTLNVDGTSRLYLGVFATSVGLYLVASRLTARWYVMRRLSKLKNRCRVLLVGHGISANRFLDNVHSHPELGVQVLGSLGERAVGGNRHLGGVERLSAMLSSRIVDEVVICLPFEQWPTVRDCARIAEEQGKTVRIPMSLTDDMHSRNRVDQVGDVSLLSLVSTPDDVLQNGLKRTMDLIGATLGLVIFSPVLAVLAIAIKADDGGPVMFRQRRIGLHGRPFRMLKLRSMSVDAEARLNEVAHLNTRESVAFKAENDPRITRIGRFIRKTSLDEVPQFWNVLTGEMSLVGPRPALDREVAQYVGRHRRRLSVKPGITGLWQISGRQGSSFESWVDLDLAYIDGWTPLEDVKILAKTVPSMIKGTGE